jgi:predicted GNAT family acetyltransferase
MDVQVHDRPDRRRFEIVVDGEGAGMAAYRLRDGVVVVTHSEIDPRFRGRGLAGELARQTLDTIRARGEQVVPLCPFFARYVAEHPEYDDIVVE